MLASRSEKLHPTLGSCAAMNTRKEKIVNIDELFDRYARDVISEPGLTKEEFTAALSEAMCCGHLQPLVSQPGGAGSKGGTSNLVGYEIDQVLREFHFEMTSISKRQEIGLKDKIGLQTDCRGKHIVRIGKMFGVKI